MSLPNPGGNYNTSIVSLQCYRLIISNELNVYKIQINLTKMKKLLVNFSSTLSKYSSDARNNLNSIKLEYMFLEKRKLCIR